MLWRSWFVSVEKVIKIHQQQPAACGEWKFLAARRSDTGTDDELVQRGRAKGFADYITKKEMLERILQLAQDPLASIVFRATWTWGNRPSIVSGIDMSLNLIGCARRVILSCDRPSLASIVFHALWIWGNRQSVDCVWISLAVIVLNEKAVLHHVNRLAMFKALLLGPKSWSTWNCGRKPAVKVCRCVFTRVVLQFCSFLGPVFELGIEQSTPRFRSSSCQRCFVVFLAQFSKMYI